MSGNKGTTYTSEGAAKFAEQLRAVRPSTNGIRVYTSTSGADTRSKSSKQTERK